MAEQHREARLRADVPAIHGLRRGGKDVDARSEAGHDGFGALFGVATGSKTAKTAVHFLVISSLWG